MLFVNQSMMCLKSSSKDILQQTRRDHWQQKPQLAMAWEETQPPLFNQFSNNNNAYTVLEQK